MHCSLLSHFEDGKVIGVVDENASEKLRCQDTIKQTPSR